MRDDEKEALRNFKSEYETCDHYSSDLIIELDDAEIILNLIEKQSKEIEELKEEYSTKLLSNAGIYQLGFNDGINSVENKIKAKIEELDYNDISNFERRCKQEVLKEVLDKG